MHAQPWMSDANCLTQGNPDDWHADRRNPIERERHYRAKAICRDCPVRSLCLQFAQSTQEPSGIWGGFDPDERYEMRKRAQRMMLRRAMAM